MRETSSQSVSAIFRSVIVAAALTMPGVAMAEEGEPAITTATYGAWTLRCIAPEGAPKTCETLHNIQIQGQAGPIAQVAIGRPEVDGDLHLAIRVPLDVWIPAGVSVAVPETEDAVDLPIVRCMPDSCIADRVFDGDLLDQFGEAEIGSITFQGPNKQPLTLPFPLEGFRGAFAAMEK